MTTKPIGLYIHIPFCVSKCKYCDFCSLGGAYDQYIDAYLDALFDEAEQYRREEPIAVDTLYFGGGTPSLLSVEKLGKILERIRSVFDLSPLREFTLEANPGTLTKEKADGFIALGVNRISLGMQTIHSIELEKLGRIHTFEDFLRSYNMLRDAGFDNIGIDLMYGIPEQTVSSFRETLSRVIELRPEHISAYGLIIEEGTPFFEMRDTLALPDEDTECNMYLTACNMLREAGYEHYEISNYSLKGRPSLHNLKYWETSPYIGLGAAAYSYFDGVRYGNPKSVSRYIGGERRTDVDPVDRKGEENEYIMMRLRLSDGIVLSEYSSEFGKSFTEGREAILSSFEKLGFLSVGSNSVSLTEKGFYISNTVICDLLDP